jgi:hypothetical protein
MMFAQWYQTKHQRPILGGNTSRNPELKFQYFTEAPVINSIIAVETGHKLDEAVIASDKLIAPDVLRFFGTRYVVWHSPRQEQNRAALEHARAYIENVLPVTKFYDATDDTGQTIAYRVNELPPFNQTVIRPNDPLARLNFAEGWGVIGDYPLWATRRESKLFVRKDDSSNIAISFRAFTPVEKQFVTVIVNGRVVGTLAMQKDWGGYSLQVPLDKWQIGINEIVLQFDRLEPITSLDALASIVAYSAGSEVGDFAHIYINGVDAAQNKRGYNIVVIDLTSGKVESSEAYDTFASAEESVRMAHFINAIPNGKIVAVAVRDEASRNLTEEAVISLRSIGARLDLRGKFRWSYAIIGVKRSALLDPFWEGDSETKPVQISITDIVGTGMMEPNVAAAIAWIKIEEVK